MAYAFAITPSSFGFDDEGVLPNVPGEITTANAAASVSDPYGSAEATMVASTEISALGITLAASGSAQASGSIPNGDGTFAEASAGGFFSHQVGLLFELTQPTVVTFTATAQASGPDAIVWFILTSWDNGFVQRVDSCSGLSQAACDAVPGGGNGRSCVSGGTAAVSV